MNKVAGGCGRRQSCFEDGETCAAVSTVTVVSDKYSANRNNAVGETVGLAAQLLHVLLGKY